MTQNKAAPSSHHVIRNVFLPDGSFAGTFMDEPTAVAWLSSQGYDLSKCEISTRRPERKPRGFQLQST
jgi:hypothetical protein